MCCIIFSAFVVPFKSHSPVSTLHAKTISILYVGLWIFEEIVERSLAISDHVRLIELNIQIVRRRLKNGLFMREITWPADAIYLFSFRCFLLSINECGLVLICSLSHCQLTGTRFSARRSALIIINDTSSTKPSQHTVQAITRTTEMAIERTFVSGWWKFSLLKYSNLSWVEEMWMESLLLHWFFISIIFLSSSRQFVKCKMRVRMRVG